MPVITRDKLPALIKAARDGDVSPIYLLFGERFMCREAAKQLEEALLACGGTTHAIDGDREDTATTIAKLRSFSLLPGRQIFRVTDTRLFHSRKVAKSLWNRAVKAHDDNKAEQAARALRAMLEAGGLDPGDSVNAPAELSAGGWQKCFGFARPAGDLSWTGKLLVAAPEGQAAASAHDGDHAELLQKTLTAGIPTANVLILLSEEVDKRKRLFKLLKDKYVIIDVSVDTGSSAGARKEQKSVLRELVQKTLANMEKTMAPPVADQLFERVGFHPVGVVMETEKLALSIGERKQINSEDLDAIVGRTRQEALFELTGALGEGNVEKALLIAGRLQENGIHALAVVATLRNYARTLLLFRSLQQQPRYGYRPSMASTAFQQQCLPRLKELERWKKELTGHPYALYMQFKTASGYSIDTLKQWMQLILSAEMRLKGSPVKAATVLHHLIFSMLNP